MFDVEALTKAVGELDEPKTLDILKNFAEADPIPEDVALAVAACQSGMIIVGDQFSSGEYFVGDLVFAGEVLNEAFNILKSVIGSETKSQIGKIILTTVEGDLHDIGKNIFKRMAEASGFGVIDLGIDIPAEVIIGKIKEIKPDILGMSGVLTLSLDSMKKTVDLLCESGLRDGLKVILGGAPVTAGACESIGADAFTDNAAEGVRICKQWLG